MQYRLATANGKPDLIPSLGWSHADGGHTLNFGFNTKDVFSVRRASRLAFARNNQQPINVEHLVAFVIHLQLLSCPILVAERCPYEKETSRVVVII